MYIQIQGPILNAIQCRS